MRSSSVGRSSGATRSDNPVPRLSHRITRPSENSRSIQRALAGSSPHGLSIEPTQPKVTRMSGSPSLATL